MEKEYNKDDIDFNAIEGDFYGFLEEKNWDAANVIIDNLAELKEFEKGLEFCMKRCAAIMKDRMTLPSDYGMPEMENMKRGFDEFNDALRGLKTALKDEETIY